MRYLLHRPKHRRTGRANVLAYANRFEPRHCDGDTCFHDHTGASRPQPSDPRRRQEVSA